MCKVYNFNDHRQKLLQAYDRITELDNEINTWCFEIDTLSSMIKENERLIQKDLVFINEKTHFKTKIAKFQRGSL